MWSAGKHPSVSLRSHLLSQFSLDMQTEVATCSPGHNTCTLLGVLVNEALRVSGNNHFYRPLISTLIQMFARGVFCLFQIGTNASNLERRLCTGSWRIEGELRDHELTVTAALPKCRRTFFKTTFQTSVFSWLDVLVRTHWRMEPFASRWNFFQPFATSNMCDLHFHTVKTLSIISLHFDLHLESDASGIWTCSFSCFPVACVLHCLCVV